MEFDYLVCENCMTRVLYQTGSTIRLDREQPLGYTRIVEPERVDYEASAENAQAWEELARYREAPA